MVGGAGTIGVDTAAPELATELAFIEEDGAIGGSGACGAGEACAMLVGETEISGFRVLWAPNHENCRLWQPVLNPRADTATSDHASKLWFIGL